MNEAYPVVQWAIPVNKKTPLWRNVDCVRGGLSRPEYLSQGVIYMIDNNYVWGGGGGGERKKYISPRGSIPFHYMSGRGRGRNTLVCRGIIICQRGVLWDKVIMSQGGDGIHHLSRGMTVAENFSMGVNQGNYYVLGGYGKFFLHRGVFFIYWNSPM